VAPGGPATAANTASDPLTGSASEARSVDVDRRVSRRRTNRAATVRLWTVPRRHGELLGGDQLHAMWRRPMAYCADDLVERGRTTRGRRIAPSGRISAARYSPSGARSRSVHPPGADSRTAASTQPRRQCRRRRRTGGGPTSSTSSGGATDRMRSAIPAVRATRTTPAVGAEPAASGGRFGPSRTVSSPTAHANRAPERISQLARAAGR